MVLAPMSGVQESWMEPLSMRRRKSSVGPTPLMGSPVM